MNSLYHIAILEGYLSQHPELPRNVKEAIEHFKQQSSPVAPIAKPKKKRKLTPQQLEHLAKMRASNGIRAYSDDDKTRIKSMRAEGKSSREIAESLGRSTRSVDNAVHNYKL